MSIWCISLKLALACTVLPLAFAATNEGDARVVGGVETAKHEFPSRLAGLPGCGSTLLHPQWAMTAGHCVKSVQITSIFVKAGAHAQPGDGWDEAPLRKALKVYIHERYEENGNHFANDIALIKLESPFDLSDIIQTVTLPTKDYVEQGRCAWVTGYGLTCIYPGNNTGVDCGTIRPRKTDVPILTQEKCTEYLGYPYINDTMICAGYDEGGKDSCTGDSGGPLYVVEDGKQIQVGIVSWGRGCALPMIPGAYTRVGSYLDWIAETVRKDGE